MQKKACYRLLLCAVSVATSAFMSFRFKRNGPERFVSPPQSGGSAWTISLIALHGGLLSHAVHKGLCLNIALVFHTVSSLPWRRLPARWLWRGCRCFPFSLCLWFFLSQLTKMESSLLQLQVICPFPGAVYVSQGKYTKRKLQKNKNQWIISTFVSLFVTISHCFSLGTLFLITIVSFCILTSQTSVLKALYRFRLMSRTTQTGLYCTARI